ncbi:MAG: hypothetical protein CVV49_02400 [Spirochaetae bacterium HGW-Spirochaetae-5]|nr:MAG: hypothetical protein CVV49_02400 [Spirochaetae bacterium HGW-Spirochaetae-5]
MNKPFLKAGYIGLSVIVISIILIAVNPSKGGKLPQGFFTPVVAFEFISTEGEVLDLFGDAPSGFQGEMVERMRTGTYIDFIYMFVYTSFLLYFSIICSRITGEKWFLFSFIIALIIFAADSGENIQLLSIMDKLNSGGFERELLLLDYFTWAKWGGLSALFISLIPFLRKTGVFGRIISIVSLISAVAGSAAYLNRSIMNEIYVLTIVIVFIMLFVFSFTFRISSYSGSK